MSVVGLKTDYTTPHRVVAFTSQVIPPNFIIKGASLKMGIGGQPQKKTKKQMTNFTKTLNGDRYVQ